MPSPRICVSITGKNIDAVKRVAPLVDLFEVRIDLIGKGWQEVVEALDKPWIACNRKKDEGGAWEGDDASRIDELLKAIDFGVAVVDIELSTPGVAQIVKDIKGKAEVLLSYHNLEKTPSLNELSGIIDRQLEAGADICKVVTTACTSADNITVLQLIRNFTENSVMAFAMGKTGQLSRVLCPLVGGYLTYASIEPGKESATGQLTVAELRKIYSIISE